MAGGRGGPEGAEAARGGAGHGGDGAVAALQALGGPQLGEHGQSVREVGWRGWRVAGGAHLWGRGWGGSDRSGLGSQPHPQGPIPQPPAPGDAQSPALAHLGVPKGLVAPVKVGDCLGRTSWSILDARSPAARQFGEEATAPQRGAVGMGLMQWGLGAPQLPFIPRCSRESDGQADTPPRM